MTGVVYALPVKIDDPPLGPVNHVICSGDEAFKVTVPGPQRETLEAEGAAGGVAMIASTAIRALLHVFPVST